MQPESVRWPMQQTGIATVQLESFAHSSCVKQLHEPPVQLLLLVAVVEVQQLWAGIAWREQVELVGQRTMTLGGGASTGASGAASVVWPPTDASPRTNG